MNDAELERLLSDVESDRSERTVSLDKTDKFGEAICAFANDLSNNGTPGYLFIGATDRGTSSHAAISDELLTKLAAIRSDGNLLPAPVMNVGKKNLGGGEMAVIEVMPSDLPPVRYKGVVWVRVGPRRARATEADERLLSERRVSAARTWDARQCATVDLSDLALGLFEGYKQGAIAREVLNENHRSLEDQLASLRLLDRRSRRPTNAAVLLLGKSISSFIPGAYIQYIQYGGATAAADVLRERRLDTDLGTILRDLASLTEEISNSRPIEIGPLTETNVYDYPPVALREILVNAVIHRDYESNSPIRIIHFDDRLEIHNPGGLFGDIRAEDFPLETAYRNPVIAEAAKTMGFVNRFGRGITRSQEAMRKNGSPPPEFAPSERHFLVTLRRRP